VFQGASSLSLDAKGRLSVPTRHRDVLGATANNQLTITRHPHGCLMIFPRPEWEKFRDRIAALPYVRPVVEENIPWQRDGR
jgi:MraZ protein